MAINPEEYTISYSQLMKNTTIRDRMNMAQNDNTFFNQLLQTLTPTQMANMFPRYYRDRLPDIGGFQLATSQIAAGKFGEGLPSPVITSEAPSHVSGPRKKKTREEIEREAKLAGKTDKEKIKENLRAQGIDIDEIFKIVKTGTNLNDPRLRYLKDISPEKLKEMGVEIYQDERGRNLVRRAQISIETMSKSKVVEEMKKSGAGSRAGLSEDSSLLNFKSKKLAKELGIDDRQYNAYRQGIANKESAGGKYNLTGGASNLYDGAYQFGADAKTDAARILGVDVPSREDFKKNPELQEQFMDAFTYANHKTLMQSKKYRDMSPEDKLKALAYAHNQGGGGALEWLKTGNVEYDKFGTAGTAFSKSVEQQLEATKDQTVYDPNKEYTDEEVQDFIAERVKKDEASNVDELSEALIEKFEMSPEEAGSTAEKVNIEEEMLGDRKLSVNNELNRRVSDTVSSVLGPGWNVTLKSGGIEGRKEGTSRRHTAYGPKGQKISIAGDYLITNSETGKRPSQEQYALMGQYWLAKKYGSMGVPGASPQGAGKWAHFDMIGANADGLREAGFSEDQINDWMSIKRGESRYWYYGGVARGQAELLSAGLEGKLPDNLYEPEPVTIEEKPATLREMMEGSPLQPPDTSTEADTLDIATRLKEEKAKLSAMGEEVPQDEWNAQEEKVKNLEKKLESSSTAIPTAETSNSFANTSAAELEQMLLDETAKGDSLEEGSKESYESMKKRSDMLNALERKKQEEPLPETTEAGLYEGGIINAKDNLKVVREDGSPTGIRVASDETAVIIPPDERRKARDFVSLDGTDQRDGFDTMDESVMNSQPIEAPLNQAKMSTAGYSPSNQSTVPSSLGAIDYSPSAMRAYSRDKYADNHGFHSAPRTIYTQK